MALSIVFFHCFSSSYFEVVNSVWSVWRYFGMSFLTIYRRERERERKPLSLSQSSSFHMFAFDLGFLGRKQRKEETLSLLQAGAKEEETQFLFFFRKRVIRDLTATLKPIPGQGRLKARAQQSLKMKTLKFLFIWQVYIFFSTKTHK